MNKPQQTGFTLLEMLVALSVSALLVTLAYSAVHIGIRSWDSSRERVDQMDALRITWRFLHHTLTRARPVFDPTSPDKHLLFEGSENALRFATDMPSYLGLGGLYVAQLSSVPKSQQNTLQLGRALLASYHKEGTVPKMQNTILLDDLQTITINYFGSKDNQTTASWHTDWAAQKNLPTLIRIEIEDTALGHWPVLIAAPYLGQINDDKTLEAE